MTSAQTTEPTHSGIAAALQRALPAGTVRQAQKELLEYQIAECLPVVAVLPESAEHVASVLRMAQDPAWGVVPWGAGKDIALGRRPTRYDIALSLAKLNRVIEHDVENLTLTAQAGLSVAQANRAVHAAHQFSPLGHDKDDRTLGGLVASNAPVPRRLVYGDIRDQLLAVAVAMPDGRLVRFGRKVIKNVAGYDMNKLFTGSAGTLGVIVEVTLKLSSLPDEAALAIACFNAPEQAFAAAAEIYSSRLAPAQIVLLDGKGAHACLGIGGASTGSLQWVCVGFEGRAIGVRRQTHDALAIMTRHGGQKGDVFAPWAPVATAWLDRPGRQGSSTIGIRIGAEPTRLGVWSDALKQLAGSAESAIVADYGGGWLRCGFEVATDTLAKHAGAEMIALRTRIESERGYLALERAPTGVMEEVGAWGGLGGEAALMQTLRRKMDPKETMSPGRFF
jgi:glycolate oxidase FAD binding subunit